MKGEPLGKFFFRKKVSQCRKKLKGGTIWSRPALYVMWETFWFCSLGQQGKLHFVELLVELFWSLQVYRKKTDEKP